MSSQLDSIQINQLIAEKHYEEAKSILRASADPAAKLWVANLDRQFPSPSLPSYGASSWSNRNSYVSPYYKERGVLLPIWLVFASIVNPLAALYILFNSRYLDSRSVILTILNACVNLVCLYGIWDWKKWGAYGFFGVAIVSSVVSLASLKSGAGIAGALIGIMILVNVCFLISSKWKMFT